MSIEFVEFKQPPTCLHHNAQVRTTVRKGDEVMVKHATDGWLLAEVRSLLPDSRLEVTLLRRNGDEIAVLSSSHIAAFVLN